MDARELEVNDMVAVARIRTFGSDISLGTAKVVKKNKVRITVERITDGYQWNFSAKSGLLILGGSRLDGDVFVEPIESQKRREEYDELRKKRTFIIDQIRYNCDRVGHYDHIVELAKELADIQAEMKQFNF